MSFLIDTNVISELRKGRKADQGVRDWFESVEDNEIFISVIVLGEIRYGIEKLKKKDSLAAFPLERWLEYIRVGYDERVLPVTVEIADIWGKLMVIRTMAPADGLLGASALFYDLTLVTRNTADFTQTGVRIFNPFLQTKK